MVAGLMASSPQTTFYQSYATRFADVAELGKVRSQQLPSGNWRYQISISHRGKRYYLGTVTVGAVDTPFESRDHAVGVLAQIRALVANGDSVQQAIARFRPMECPEDFVENRVAEYLEHWRGLVDKSKRSPATLREIERYAQREGKGTRGAWAYWYGQNAKQIPNGAVEDWHAWLCDRGIGATTQGHVSDAFRSFLRRLEWRGEIDRVPNFPAIERPEYAPRTISLSRRDRIFEAIPYERRGAFLIAACLLMRPREIRACELGDYDIETNTLLVNKAFKGQGIHDVVRSTKEGTSTRREVWDDATRDWILWRLKQTTDEQRLRGEATALFWNPRANDPRKGWSETRLRYQWRDACETVGVRISLYEGTKHSTATALAEGGIQPLVLKALGGWKDSKSVEKYAKPRATRAIVLDAKRKGER
jgi:integrase